MEKLNVRFSESTKKAITAGASCYDLTDSIVARAALNIGLKAISEFNHDEIVNFYNWIEKNQKA
jgi:hypothetical protein